MQLHRACDSKLDEITSIAACIMYTHLMILLAMPSRPAKYPASASPKGSKALHVRKTNDTPEPSMSCHLPNPPLLSSLHHLPLHRPRRPHRHARHGQAAAQIRSDIVVVHTPTTTADTLIARATHITRQIPCQTRLALHQSCCCPTLATIFHPKHLVCPCRTRLVVGR